MTHLSTYKESSHCTYRGEDVPMPLLIDDLLTELQFQHEGAAAPLANVVETANTFTVEVAAPGLKTADFLVSIQQNVLPVSVLHKETDCKRKYHLYEFNSYCFKREVELPANVDMDFISALYKDGILKVILPKSNEEAVNNVERVIVY